MQLTVKAPQAEEETEPKEEVTAIPPYGSLEWIHYWSDLEGHLPSPINVSITGSLVYYCPELKWYNFDVYPHKVKMTNTGYTVLIGAKWKTERPYLEGGCFLEKHVISQIHFHWGADMTEGSDHAVDKRIHPAEMQIGWAAFQKLRTRDLYHVSKFIQRLFVIDRDVELPSYQPYQLYEALGLHAPTVTFFKADYMTQEEALKHNDGVVVVCYLIKYGVNPDDHLAWLIEGFPRIREAQTNTRVGPYPMSRLLPMFYEDYFLYWGTLDTVAGESHTVRWLVPRANLHASFEQMREFRKLWDPWDEPNLANFRPLQEREDRHIFLINPHWNQYNSLLPIPRVPEASISVLSPAYQANLWMLPPQNSYMLPQTEENAE